MPAKQMIWSGQGPIYFGTFDTVNGTPEMGYLTGVFKIGAANSTLTTSISRETKKVKESDSGQRMDLAEIETAKSMTVKLDMAQFDRDVLARGLYGVSNLITAGSATGEVLPTLAANEYFFTKYPKASAITVTDSAGTPITLVAGTDYKVIDADFGMCQMLNPAAGTPPYKLAYSYADQANVTAFTATTVQTGIIYTGTNQDGDKARLIIPKMTLAQSGDFPWIGDTEATLSMEGSAFYIPELASDADWGGFMQVGGLPQ